MNHSELVTHSSEPIQAIGQSFYFVASTQEAGTVIGIEDVVTFYALGRSGVLGDVDHVEVSDRFYWFKPEMVEAIYSSATVTHQPSEVAPVHLAAAHAYARATFSDTPELRAFCDAAEQVVSAIDGFEAPLFQGYRAFPLPMDTPARALQLAIMLREARGEAFIAAARRLGLDPAIGHYIAHPEMFALFGYSDEDIPEVTDEARALRDSCEEMTEELLVPAFATLDEDAIEGMVLGMVQMQAEIAGAAASA